MIDSSDWPDEGSHSRTRPSSLVRAWKLTAGCGMLPWASEGFERANRDKVVLRLAAGVPDKVLSTWQVIGEDIVERLKLQKCRKRSV